jgi:hypothetical protein
MPMDKAIPAAPGLSAMPSIKVIACVRFISISPIGNRKWIRKAINPIEISKEIHSL